jgi:hypothetical protein
MIPGYLSLRQPKVILASSDLRMIESWMGRAKSTATKEQKDLIV